MSASSFHIMHRSDSIRDGPLVLVSTIHLARFARCILSASPRMNSQPRHVTSAIGHYAFFKQFHGI